MKIKAKALFLERLAQAATDRSHMSKDVELELKDGWVILGDYWLPPSQCVMRGVEVVREVKPLPRPPDATERLKPVLPAIRRKGKKLTT